VRIEFIWLRTQTSGGLLWTRQWTFGLHKRRGISWLAERTIIFLKRNLFHGVKFLFAKLACRPQCEFHRPRAARGLLTSDSFWIYSQRYNRPITAELRAEACFECIFLMYILPCNRPTIFRSQSTQLVVTIIFFFNYSIVLWPVIISLLEIRFKRIQNIFGVLCDMCVYIHI
jgi:hypothetical protein